MSPAVPLSRAGLQRTTPRAATQPDYASCGLNEASKVKYQQRFDISLRLKDADLSLMGVLTHRRRDSGRCETVLVVQDLLDDAR